MSVEFNEDNGFGRRDFGGTSQQTPKIAAWLISKGLAKDVAGANKIQIASSLVFFAAAIYFFLK
jgi:hypothetical protein